MRQYTSGVYGLLPLGHRVIAKIERIVREEMDRVGGQEIRMPCMSTAELWSESGRYQAIGKDMFRLKDRGEKPMVLNMTHEEPVVFLARTELTSYKQLPAMVYQIQSKFRDEPRPRGGLVRLREFIMKDGYSFHTDEEGLKQYYWQVHEAYVRSFRRVGLKKFVSVQSDNGMFGGKFSHEFQLLVPTGEDKLITCTQCDYRANLEIAMSRPLLASGVAGDLKKIPTPGTRTIADLCTFLSIDAKATAKAVMMQTLKGELIVAMIRGDLEVVDNKLRALVGAELVPATDAVMRAAGAVAGSTGPRGLDLSKCRVVLDRSVEQAQGVVTGANQDDAHFAHFDMQRDFFAALTPKERERVITGDFAAARPGDPCPECGAALQETRGIEIGNIFHLGTKYTESMDCGFLDQNGKKKPHVMGCYGIGITRLLPSVIEEHHDERGPIFPMAVAPFAVHLCVLNLKEAPVREAAEKLYASLIDRGIEVLFDDRDEKAGPQFADADLMGIPLRLILSPKTLADGMAELKWRDGREPLSRIPLAGLEAAIESMIKCELAK